MNKKAAVFELIMAFLFVVLLLVALKVLVYDKSQEVDRSYVGETSIKIIELDNKAKLTKFLIEKTANVLKEKALVETAAQGGGYEKWSERPNTKPAPKRIFLEIFKKLFNEYVKKLGYLNEGYIIEEKNNKLNFRSKGKLWFDSNPVQYSIKHDFEMDLNYDFNIYDKLHKQFHEPVENCGQLNLPKESICSDGDKHINIEVPTQDLMFVKPIIKFKLGIKKQAPRI